jgi:hypothetical protein
MVRCYDVLMRTTLDLDDAVLAAARSLARDESISLGAAVSELARRGLRAGATVTSRRSGFPVIEAAPDTVVTLELVNRYRDDD